jgi:hypothetical protein
VAGPPFQPGEDVWVRARVFQPAGSDLVLVTIPSVAGAEHPPLLVPASAVARPSNG